MSGAVRDFTPHLRVESRRELNLLPGGEGPFCSFSITNRWKEIPGVYVFLVDGAPVYVGECKCLVKRVNQGYGHIAPRNCFVGGQATNIRINSLIREAILKIRTVDLVFCRTDSRKRVESEMIGSLKPQWNRAAPWVISRPTAMTAIADHAGSSNVRLVKQASTCRDQVVKAARAVVQEKGQNEFTVLEVVARAREIGVEFSENTIRTHVTSRCCKNAPKNHAVTYDDFERIAPGLYRIV